MVIISDVLKELQSLANPDAIPRMRHFGLTGENRLGIAVPKLRTLAKQIGKDHVLALELWDTTIPEARILAAMIDDPELVTPDQMDNWAHELTAWDICDAACNNLFIHTPYAWNKIYQWAGEQPEFTRRAGYVLIACLATHDKGAPDQQFIDTFPVIKAGSSDPRNFVRKAVNWAIRGIGKRNIPLNRAAITLAEEIHALDDKTARWIASDALRELKSDKVQQRLANKAARKK